MFSTIFKKIAAFLRKMKVLKDPRWRTCCETTVCHSNSFSLKLNCSYGKNLANPKLLACQSLIFYAQPFGKCIGVPNDPPPQIELTCYSK